MGQALDHLPIKYNDPCPCNSGKKYKECCISRIVAQNVSEEVQAFYYMEEFFQIKNLEDQEEALICYDVLSSRKESWDTKSVYLEKLHLLLKKFPAVGDLWALLVIGYRELNIINRAKKILRKSCIRFSQNPTLTILSYLERFSPPPNIPPFPLSTVTQTLLWDFIQIKRDLEKESLTAVSKHLEQIIANGEEWNQEDHWILIETLLFVMAWNFPNERQQELS